MTEQISPRKKLAAIITIAVGLSLTPVTVTSQEKLTSNDACADEQCCPELGSWCGNLMGYYHALDGCSSDPSKSGW